MTGRDIKKIRSKLLLLQDELAKELGVSVCSVRLWETNKMGISIKTQRKVLEFCKKKGVKI